MIKKRFLSMLVLLAAVVTSAVAQTPALNLTNPAVGQVIGDDGKNYAYASLPGGVTAVAKICYVSGSNGLALALADEGEMNWSTAMTTAAAHTPAFTGGTWKLATEDEWKNMITAAGSYTDLRDGFSGITGASNLQSAYYWSSTESSTTDRARACSFINGSWVNRHKSLNGQVRACLAWAQEAATVAVTGVTLSPTTATLTLGETETVTLTAIVAPDEATDKTVTWSSSNTSVATVSNEGVVTAVAAGEATITVTATNGTDVTTDDQTATCTVTVAEPTYKVSLKEGTDDATSWQGKAGTGEYQALPLEGVAAGTAVTVKYDGTKKVKSVKAKKKAAPTIDLATVTEATTVEDGYTVTGKLDAKVKISIAEGATVTLDGVTINGANNSSYSWAGITCLGDATIILSGTNTVKGFYEDYPGIHVPQNKTVTIQGSGSLTASSRGFGCGIGGGSQIACGNIVIAGGTITATGGGDAAGIGSGLEGSCGNISITGGTVTANDGGDGAGIGSGNMGSCGNISITGGTITATGSHFAAGIGSGKEGQCGNITITNGVTSLTATKGNDANYSIGFGSGGFCGTVTIGCSLDSNGNIISGTGSTGTISTSPYTYQPSN